MTLAAANFYRSNRAEVLIERLARLVERPVGDPLSPETIVVQGRGMAIWISQELSRQHGISANLDFVYPKHFFQRVLSAVLGESGALAENYSPHRLFWSVFRLLPAHLSYEEFRPLARYLKEDLDGTRRYQLCEAIARCFDQYLTYRPDVVRAWLKPRRAAGAGRQLDLFEAAVSSPAAGGWQARLLSSLVTELGDQHPPALERRLISALRGSTKFPELPGRVSFFGISSLPPLYVRVIGALARHAQVSLFLLSPSSAPWAQGMRPGDPPVRPGDGNSLLSSLGILGAEFQELLAAELETEPSRGRGEPLTPNAAATNNLYSEPVRDTLLHALQTDIFEFKHPHARSHRFSEDDSLSVHSCHSAMREVEVLHDQLLHALDQDPTLEPHDILVMMPDVDQYAPLIEAVFERDTADPTFIPYRIADRTLAREAPVVDGFRRLLKLVDARITASQVLDLLTIAAVRQRFNITSSDVEDIAQWVIRANIRWGIDAEHRRAHGQPDWRDNTWELGLKRLLIGYALPPQGERLFRSMLPLDEVEGGQAQLLGKFMDFTHALFTGLAKLRAERGVVAWQLVLGEVLDTMFANERDTAWQHQRLRLTLDEMVRDAQAAGFDDDVHLHVVEQLLERRLDEALPTWAFLAGGVTFCALVPARSIPFRMVCTIGLNDGAFPRAEHAPNFDLIAHDPKGHRLGDRRRRIDDRYLFLEAILSARDRFIVTYTGQSIKDNSEIPPSVVVSELLDYIEQHYAFPGSEEAPKQAWAEYFVRHPLQPFSPRYFDGKDARLFSYEGAYLEALRGWREERRQPKPLFQQPLAAANVEQISVDDLLRFFAGPLRYLLNRRLNVFLRDAELDVPDREPHELTGLESYAIGNALLALLRQGAGDAAALALARASGALPAGNVGRFAFLDVLTSARPLADLARHFAALGSRPNLMLDRQLANHRITGEISHRWTSGLLQVQFSRLQAKHSLRCWIRHLLLCWVRPAQESAESFLAARPETGQGASVVRFRHVREPEEYLKELVDCFAAGQTEPLLFFPTSALAYAETLARTRDAASAWATAERVWPKEVARDPYLRRVYGSDAQLSDLRMPDLPPTRDFSALAIRVFAPMLQYAEYFDDVRDLGELESGGSA